MDKQSIEKMLKQAQGQGRKKREEDTKLTERIEAQKKAGKP